MHKIIKGFFVCLFFVFFIAMANTGHAEDDIYYARCNLKVLKGNKITWVNYQSAPSFIPAGTKLKVTKSDSDVTLLNMATNVSYSIDAGASGDQFLEKFVTKKPVSLDKFPENVQADIKQAVPRIGMTKEQVYLAMGPPPYIDGKNVTQNLTYDAIMKGNLWVWRRMKIGKTIGVEFDPASGTAKRVEGVWGK